MDHATLEYIVKRRSEGKLLGRKIALIVGYIILLIVLAIVILNLAPPLLHIPFLLIDLAFCALVAYVSWRFTEEEYEIVLSGGEITATVIYGKSIRHRLLSIPINAIFEFGLYDDKAYEKLCRASLNKNFVCVSSLSAPTIYYALFSMGKDRAILYFEADERAIKYLKAQNSAAARAGNIR